MLFAKQIQALENHCSGAPARQLEVVAAREAAREAARHCGYGSMPSGHMVYT